MPRRAGIPSYFSQTRSSVPASFELQKSSVPLVRQLRPLALGAPRPTRLLSHYVLSSGPPLSCSCGWDADARNYGVCWQHPQALPCVTDGHLTVLCVRYTSLNFIRIPQQDLVEGWSWTRADTSLRRSQIWNFMYNFVFIVPIYTF